MSETSDQIRGHKANLSNPNTSEASKEKSRKIIDAFQESNQDPPGSGVGDSKSEGVKYQQDTVGTNTGNVIGGHKANLKNRKTSRESKERSRNILDEMGA